MRKDTFRPLCASFLSHNLFAIFRLSGIGRMAFERGVRGLS